MILVCNLKEMKVKHGSDLAGCQVTVNDTIVSGRVEDEWETHGQGFIHKRAA